MSEQVLSELNSAMKSADTPKTWTVNGQAISEDEVTVYEIDDYLRDDLISPMEDLFLIMEDNSLMTGTPMARAGTIGSIITSHVNERISQVFHRLYEKDIQVEVIVANMSTPGIAAGTLIDVEVTNRK